LLASPAVGQDIVGASISFEAITISSSETASAVELELPTKTFLPGTNNIYEVPKFVAFGNSFTDVSVTISYSYRNAHPTAARGAFIRCSVAEEPVPGSNVDIDQDGVPGAEQLRAERDFGVFRTTPRSAAPGQTIEVASTTLEPVPLLLLDRSTVLTFQCRLTARVNDVPGVSVATSETIVVNQVMVPHDSIEILFVTPAPEQTLEGGSEQDFVGSIRYLLGTEDAGEIFMSLSLQDETIVAISERVAVENTGRARTRSFKLAATLPDTDFVFLSAFLRGPNDEELAQSDPVRFAVVPAGACVIPTEALSPKSQARPCDIDFSIQHIELNQAVQTNDNVIPMIRDKRTVARVFVTGDGIQGDGLRPAVQVTLRGQAGVNGPMLDPIEGLTGTVPVLTAGVSLFAARKLFASANFILPREWTQVEALSLTASANLDGSGEPIISESEEKIGNNKRVETFPFIKRGPLNIAFLELCLPGCPNGNLFNADRFLRKVYPLAEFSGVSYFPYLGDFPGFDKVQLRDPTGLIKIIKLARLLEAGIANVGVIWLPVDQENLPDGITSAFSGTQIVFIGSTLTDDLAPLRAFQNVLALRIANIFGIGSERGCNSAVSAEFADAVGVDISKGSVVVKSLERLSDFARDCKPPEKVWISAAKYGRLFLDFPPAETSARLSADRTQAKQQGTPNSFFLISGTIGSNGAGSLLPTFRIESSTAVADSSEGNFCVGVASGSSLLSETCLNRVIDSGGDDQPFVVLLPFHAEADRIVLTRGTTELDVNAASTSPPSVTIGSPAAGTSVDASMPLNLSWTATDADGDSLLFLVQYSRPDSGGSWFPLGIDVLESSLTINPARLQGGEGLLFRVLASDGFHTTEQTIGPVNVVQRPAIAV
ncbi:MAG: hypothetical protein O6850_01095, partial [Acidobacteria bacterium]|nr:hypothetical protein [Acidobacteriota bacterium]